MKKKKDSYYFPHEFNSRNDPKCSALIRDFNYEGYGIFWALIEIIHEQGGRIEKFPKLYEGLAFQLGIEQEKLTKQIEAMLHVLHLLQENKKYIWSERVLTNFKNREAKRLAKVEAGRLGGIASGKTRAEAKRSNALSTPKQTKQRKGKERKGNKRKEKNKDIHFRIFSYWNSRKIIIHKSLTEKMTRAINGRLNEKHTEKEIICSIKNYAQILSSKDYYFKYKWTLQEFLQRGFDKFLDWETAKSNYLQDGFKKNHIQEEDPPPKDWFNRPKEIDKVFQILTKASLEERRK